MSIQSEITRISGNVSNSLTAVANKGVTVPSGSNSDDLADLIDLIVVDPTYSVSQSLTNASSSADDTKVIAGNSFFADLTPTSGYTLHEITVTMGGVDVTDQVFKPGTGTKVIRANGTYLASNDALSGYSSVTVNVPSGGGGSTLGTKTITANGTYEAEDDALDGYSSVTVNVPTGTARTSSDLTASGATVTVPAGLYAEQATKTVASGSASTPATTITANPSISVSASGLITATASASKSVTPSVSAGYVSSGTAGTVSVSGSNNQQLTTQAAQTLYPSTSDQTITSGKYLIGTQTIKGVAVSNTLTAENVKSGVTITIGDSADADRITSVTGTYTGGTSKNTQVVQGTTRTNSSTLTAIGSELTVSTSGEYDIYYTCFRTNTSSSYTWGTQLYIGGTAYGSENTTWTNNQQNTHLSNISLTAGQKLRVYGRETRGTSYYVCSTMLAIVEA